MVLPFPDSNHHVPKFANGDTAFVCVDGEMQDVIVTGVSTKTDENGVTVHVYKYKFFNSAMVMRFGERETDSTKSDLVCVSSRYCPFSLNEKALIVTPTKNKKIPDEIRHVFITSVACEGSGKHTKYTYKFMECESTLTKDDNGDEVMVNKTGVTTSDEGCLYHLPWTGLLPFNKHHHVLFEIGH